MVNKRGGVKWQDVKTHLVVDAVGSALAVAVLSQEQAHVLVTMTNQNGKGGKNEKNHL
jgi:hypothetical protein